MPSSIRQKATKELLKNKISSKEYLTKIKRKISKKYNISILKNSEILEFYKKNYIEKNRHRVPALEKILRKRAVRTLSGIAPIAVLTKPFPCPGKCAFCPTEKNVPQSYLSNEPAVMRAIRCGYNPYVQVQERIRALEANGHEPTKIELIVIGGTWSALPKKYKYWYIANCFKAANGYKPSSPAKKQYSPYLKISELQKKLLLEQKKNEKARYKIIGITLETRPDCINKKELFEMRELGATRVELGVQAIDDNVLKKNNRGHNVEKTIKATKLLKNFGFKITYHIMPGLPGSTYKKDLEMFKELFKDEKYQPDQIKFYPTVVTRGSRLYKWWKQKKYFPYSDKTLKKLIIECKKNVPPYVRIIRLIRDIPKESIIAGNLITNLRQIIKDEGAKCHCIRCREAGQLRIKNYKLQIQKYNSSGGQEYFVSYESKNGKNLYGFCRLRLEAQNNILPVLKKAAIIRELHVYGELVPVGSSNKKIQHTGLGKKLMAEAERIAKENNFNKIAIISGVGVRGYYRKLGYKLRDTYMIKRMN